MKKARLTFEIDSVMRLPPSAQSGICQQRAKEDNQRKLSDAACKQQQKRYKYVKSWTSRASGRKTMQARFRTEAFGLKPQNKSKRKKDQKILAYDIKFDNI